MSREKVCSAFLTSLDMKERIIGIQQLAFYFTKVSARNVEQINPESINSVVFDATAAATAASVASVASVARGYQTGFFLSKSEEKVKM